MEKEIKKNSEAAVPELKRTAQAAPLSNLVTIDDFKKCELVVAQIKDVQDHPNADKLYVLKVSLGHEERQIVAGIRPYYGKEELLGRQVVVIKNLRPATIRGVESQGMVLAVKDEKGLSVLTPHREAVVGSKVS